VQGKFEDTKGVIRSRKSKNIHYNENRQTDNDLPNIGQKTKD
jgi:hypothetical protein